MYYLDALEILSIGLKRTKVFLVPLRIEYLDLHLGGKSRGKLEAAIKVDGVKARLRCWFLMITSLSHSLNYGPHIQVTAPARMSLEIFESCFFKCITRCGGSRRQLQGAS